MKASERVIESDTETPYLTSAKPVSIGDKVWIGGG